MTGELIDAIFAGLSETPLWESFLLKLRQATGADAAFFFCHPPGSAFGRGIYRRSEEISGEEDDEAFFRSVWPVGPPTAAMFDEGRSYDLIELMAQRDPPDSALRQQFAQHSVSALRMVKVTEPSGVEAWLFVTKTGGRFDPAVDGLLEALAPVLRGAVQIYIDREQERYRAALGIEAASRSRIGWLTLDGGGRVLEHDEGCARLLAENATLRIDGGGALRVDPIELEHEIHRAIRRIGEGKTAGLATLTLSRKPWIEITLQPARRTPISTTTPAIVLAYVHHDVGEAEVLQSRLRTVLALSNREAELAMRLGQGSTIRQAAEDLGVTVQTARSYLRSIYAKTGAAGLPDLVRMVSRTLVVGDR